MGPGCSVPLRNAVSDLSVAGAEAEGDIELINTGENSHLFLTVSKNVGGRRSIMAGVCSRCLTKEKMMVKSC